MQHPTLAAWISARPDAVKQLLEWALDDTVFAHVSLSRVIVPLRQKADAAARLAEAVKQAGFAAVKAGDRLRVLNAFEVILPMAAPGKAGAVWSEVLAQGPAPDALTWEMRWHLLPRLIRFRHTNGGAATVDPALVKWLDVQRAEKLVLEAIARAEKKQKGRAAMPTRARTRAPPLASAREEMTKAVRRRSRS